MAATGGEHTETRSVDGLSVRGLTVRFGGLVAVDGVDLHAPRARCTGLIGPNGAGKTTTFNACSGLTRPTAGQIALDGTDITSMSPSHRARLGLGRTFQRMELWDSLSVSDNVGLGHEARKAGASPLRQVLGRRSDTPAIALAVDRAMEVCGITRLAAARPSELSTGQRRFVELARAIAAGFDLLLLDEPSSGLDKAETEQFGRILSELVALSGTGVLLVEHDMSLVMSQCDYIYVLDFGKLLFEGTPVQVASSREVQAAYLGAESVGVAADV